MSCIAIRLTSGCRGFQHQLLNSDYSKVGAFCASCHMMPLLLFGIGVEVAFSLTGVERAPK